MRLRYDPRATTPLERLTRVSCRAVAGRTRLQLTRYGPVHELAVYCGRRVAAPGDSYCPACAARAQGAARPMETTG